MSDAQRASPRDIARPFENGAGWPCSSTSSFAPSISAVVAPSAKPRSSIRRITVLIDPLFASKRSARTSACLRSLVGVESLIGIDVGPTTPTARPREFRSASTSPRRGETSSRWPPALWCGSARPRRTAARLDAAILVLGWSAPKIVTIEPWACSSKEAASSLSPEACSDAARLHIATRVDGCSAPTARTNPSSTRTFRLCGVLPVQWTPA